MIFVRSAVFNVFFFVWSALFLTLCLPFLLGSPRCSYLVGRTWSRVIFAGMSGICNLRYEIRGMELLPNEPCIVAAKHQSMWDTMIFSEIIEHPSFVLKQELTWIPLYGWFVKHSRVIAINRAGGAQALKKMLREAREILASGRKLIIFPEGTRLRPGQSAPYHPGVAALYAQLNVPVAPVVLNSGHFWPKGSFLKQPGTIVLQVLPPIAPGLDRRAFLATLQECIDAGSAALPGAP